MKVHRVRQSFANGAAALPARNQGQQALNEVRASTTMACAAALVATLSLGGCYVVPIAPDGAPVWAAVPPPSPMAANSGRPPVPMGLNARLYPANDIASEAGMLSGTVTSLPSGRGRFQLNYRGDVLIGEATRVAGDERRGIASAYGSGGNFMSCEYQMNTPYQGAGTCMFSNGGKYQVHIGN